MPVYRFFFMVVLAFLGTGACIAFFRKYRINYLYIFEIDPVKRLNQYSFYKMFVFLLTILMLFALFELLAIKGYIHAFQYGRESYFALTLLLTFLGLLFCPFNILHRDFRCGLIYSLW